MEVWFYLVIVAHQGQGMFIVFHKKHWWVGSYSEGAVVSMWSKPCIQYFSKMLILLIDWKKTSEEAILEYYVISDFWRTHFSYPGKIWCQIWLLHAVVQFQWCQREGVLAHFLSTVTQTDRSTAIQCWCQYPDRQLVPLCLHRMAQKLQTRRSSFQDWNF